MPDNKTKNPLLPSNSNAGLDNSNLDINQGLQNEADNWLSPGSGSFSEGVNLSIATPNIVKPNDKQAKPTIDSDIQNLAGTIDGSTGKQHPDDNQFLSKNDIPKDYDKYGTYYQGIDNEELAATKQGLGEKIEYGVGRAVGNFSKTVLQGITEPIVGTVAVLGTGKASSFWDNSYNKWFKSWEEAQNKAMPLFESKSEKNASWYSPKNWLTGNAVAGLLEFVGTTAGIGVTALLGNEAGIGEGAANLVGRGASQINARYINAIKDLSEISVSLPDLENGNKLMENVLQVTNELRANSAMNNADKLEKFTTTIEDINKKYMAQMGTYNKIKQGAVGMATNLGMSSGMAYNASENFKNSMIQDTINKNGSISDEERDQINEYATEVGNTTGILTSLMGAITIHGMAKGIFSPSEGEGLIRQKINELGTKETGEVFDKTFSPVDGKTFSGRLAQKSTNIAKKAFYTGKKFVNPLAAIGLTEFSMVSPSVNDYYSKKYKTGDAEVFRDAILPNIEHLATKEGISTFFMGLIAPDVFTLKSSLLESKEKRENTKQAIDSFNSTYLKSYLKANVDSIKRGKELREDYLDAIRKGDKKAEKDLEAQQLENYIYPRIKYGMKSLIDQDTEGYRKLVSTDEGLKSLQNDGIIAQDGDIKDLREKFLKHLDDIKAYSDKADNYYKTLSLKYGGYVNEDRSKRYDDEHIEKLMFLSGMVDNKNKRVKGLSEELQGDTRLYDKYINTSINKDFGGFEETTPTGDIEDLLSAESTLQVVRDNGEKKLHADELFKSILSRIDKLEITEDEKENIRSKYRDLLENVAEKRQMLKQYNDIIQHPDKFSDKVSTKLISPYESGSLLEADAKDRELVRQKGSLKDMINIETKYNEYTPVEVGESYYSGKPIASTPERKLVSEDGVEANSENKTGFRSFKILGVDKESNKIIIQSNPDKDKSFQKIYHVEPDFIKDHDIDDINNKNKSLQASFYERNKLKRFIKKVTKSKEEKENSKKGIDEAIEYLRKAGNEAFQDAKNSHSEDVKDINEKIKKAQADYDKLIQISANPGDIQNAKQALDSYLLDRDNINKNWKGEIEGTIRNYNNQIAELQKEKENLTKSPEELLQGAAREAYNKEKATYENKKEKLDTALERGMMGNLDHKEAIANLDKDFEITRKKYIDAYNKKKAELDKNKTELGTIEYSPSKDQLHFVNQRGEETNIGPKDLKDGDITKIDGSNWSDSDKEYINGFEDQQKKIEDLAKLSKLKDTINKDLKASDNKAYDDPSEDFKDLSTVTEDEQKGIQNAVDSSVEKTTGKPNKRSAKLPIDKLIRSSLNLDSSSSFYTNADSRVKEWLDSRNKWADRFNNFSAKLLQPKNLLSFWKKSDLWKDGNINKPNVIFVHSGNQEVLGLKDFITSKDLDYSKDKGINEPIYMLMVHTDANNKKWTIDNNGKKLKELNTPHTEEDYGKMVYTVRRSSLKWVTGEDAFKEGTTPEEIKTNTERFNTDTKNILGDISNSPKEHSFDVSNGIPQIYKEGPKENRRNSLSDTGLIEEDAIGGDTVQMVTLGDKGIGNITVGERLIKVPVGVPYWVRGDSVQVLDSKFLTEKNKGNIYDCIKWLSDTYLSGNDEQKARIADVQKYLSSVVFFNNHFSHDIKGETKTLKIDENGFPSNRYDKQLSIGQNLKDGNFYLMLGTKIKIPFTPDALETRKGEIKEFLGIVHHVALKKLLKGGEYYEITGFDSNKIPLTKKWNNYTHYLTGKRSDINETPLTVNMQKPTSDPVAGEQLPLRGMYITTTPEVNKEKEIVKPAEVKKEEPKTVVSTNPYSEVTINGKTIKLNGETNEIRTPDLNIDYKINLDGDKVNVEITSFGNITPDQALTLTPEEQTTYNSNIDKFKNIVLTPKIQAEVDKLVAENIQEDGEEKEESPYEKPQENTVSSTDQATLDAQRLFEEAKAKREAKKGSKPLDMETTSFDQKTPLEDVKGFKEYMNRVLPQFNIEDLPYFLKNSKGGYSWGQYDHAYKTIYLAKDAIEGTGFHEAFHAVFDSFLSNKQQKALINEFRNREGEFNTRFGDIANHNDPKITEETIIEQLADEFREYNLGKGKFTKQPAKMSFFTKLKNFIKNFIFGKPDSIKDVFNKINAGNYKDASIYDRTVPTRDMMRFPDGRVAKENTIRDFSDGILKNIREYLGVKNGGIIDFADGTKSAQDLFNDVKLDLEDRLNNPFDYTINDKDLTAEQVADFFKSMDFLTDRDADGTRTINEKNWNKLINEKIKDKLAVLGLKIDKVYDLDKEDIQGNKEGTDDGKSIVDDTPEEENKNLSKNTWGVEQFKLDAKDTAPAEIQFFFNTIVDAINESVPSYNKDLISPDKKTTPLLLDKMVEDNSMFYKTMYALSYSTNIEEMKNKLEELAKKVPALVDPYNALFGSTKPEDRNNSQWRFTSKFFKAFSKYAPEPIMQMSDDAGNNFSVSGNSATAAHEMINRWESAFKGDSKLSTKIIVDKTEGKQVSQFVVNPNKNFTTPKDVNTVFDFLKEIGFTGISKERYDTLSDSEEDKKMKNLFISSVSDMHKNLLDAQKKGVAILGTDILGSGRSIRNLAEIAAKISLEKFSSQFQRLDGEFVQTNINHNYYSKIISAIKNTKNLVEFLNNTPRLKNDVYTQHSLLLKLESNFFDKEGNTNSDISMVIDNGKIDQNGNRILLTDMTGSQRALYTLNANLRSRDAGKGLFHVFMPADQSSDFGVEMNHYISIDAFTNEGKKLYDNILKGYLADEVSLIKDATQREVYEELAKVVNDDKNGITGKSRARQLRYFKDILAPKLVKEITDYANKEGVYVDSTLDFDAFFNIIKDEFSTNLTKHLDSDVNDQFRYFSKEGLIIPTEPGYYKFNGLNTDFLKEFGINRKKGEYILTESEIKRVLRFREMNSKINTVEFSKLFYGDPANYKDFLKRAKLYNSGTESNFKSKEFNDFHNRESNKIKKGDKEITLHPEDRGYHTFKNNFRGLTFNHGDSEKTNVVSASINMIRNILKGDNESIEKYEYKNNGIDAQSYGTINFMRELKMKAGGLWSPKHEEVYQYHQSLERVRIQERLEKGEKGLKDKLFNKDRNNIYEEKKGGRVGELTSRGESMRKLDMEIISKRPEGKDYNGLFNIEKYLGAGPSDNNDFTAPNGLKTSTLPLFYTEAMEGTKLEDQYLFMIKNNIDYTGPKSQHKFGRLIDAPELYNIGNSYDTNGDIKLADIDKTKLDKSVYEQPLEFFNKIVETAGRHNTTTMGTQLRVLATMDLMDNGIPKDFYNNEEHIYNDKSLEWNNLSEKEKVEKSDLYRLQKAMDSTLSGMIKSGKKLVFNKLGLGIGKDGKLGFKSPETFVKYLKEMANTYNIPANIKDSIKITLDNQGKETVLIDQLPNRESLEYIINSAIEKYIVRPKKNGGSKILVSGEMWEKNNRKGVYFDKAQDKWITIDSKEQFEKVKEAGNKIMLTSNDLKFYTDKDGKIQGMEVKVNNHFKERMLKWAKDNKKEIMSDEELLNYLSSAEGEQLMKGIGFRIPSQGLNSFDAFKIVGFVDDSLGDAVVVPSEITTKVGSDFDVDKLNTYLKNFYIDEKGLPKKVQFFEDTNNEDNLTKIWEQNNNLSTDAYDDIDAEDVATDLLTTSKKDLEKASNQSLSLEKFITDNKGKDPYEVNSQEAIDNKYFDLLEEVILHPSNLKQLLTPNTSDYLEDIEKEISNITHRSEDTSSNVNYANNLSSLWVNRKRQEMLEGKDATSMSASGNTSHAMMQNFPYYLAPGVKINLPHKKIMVEHNGENQEVTSLANIKNINGKNISDILSQFINGTVDVANNAWIMRLLPSKSVFSQTLFLIRAGVDPKSVFYFMNQPIIQEYIKSTNKDRNLSEDERLYRTKIVKNLLQSFKRGNEVVNVPLNLTGENGVGLKDMLTDWHNYKIETTSGEKYENLKLNDHQYAMQRYILNEFIKYEDLAGELFTQQQGSYWGNMKKATEDSVYLKNKAYEKGQANPNFIGLHDNMDNTWFGTLKNTVTEMSDNINEVVFKTALPYAKSVTGSAKEYISNLRIKGGEGEKVKLLSRVKASLLDFLTGNFSKDANGVVLNEKTGDLFVNEKDSVAKKLLEIQAKLETLREKDPNADILQNSALKKLAASISNPKNPHNIVVDNKPTSVNEKDDFTSSLEELKEHPEYKDFYEDLVKLGILQSGVKKGRISFNDMIPHEDYEYYIKQGIEALENANVAIQDYDNLKVFWRTNWKDDRIVPKVYAKEILQSGESVVTLPIREGRSPIVKIVKPIKVKDATTGELREATKSELANLRNTSDYKENLYTTEGFQLVTDEFGQPIPAKYGEDENKNVIPTHHLYKQINLWGDGQNLTESYISDGSGIGKPSVLDKNVKIQELSNEEIFEKYNNQEGVKTEIVPTPQLEAERDPVEEFEKTGKVDVTKENFETTPEEKPRVIESKNHLVDLINGKKVIFSKVEEMSKAFDPSEETELIDLSEKDEKLGIIDKDGDDIVGNYIDEYSQGELDFIKQNKEIVQDLFTDWLINDTDDLGFREYIEYLSDKNKKLIDTAQGSLFPLTENDEPSNPCPPKE